MFEIFGVVGIIAVIFLICGLLMMTIGIMKMNEKLPETKVIVKYIPKTFDEDQREQPFVSEIFKSMFTDQTPWVSSIMDYDRRKQEAVNKYYISQI